jgi:hypothetical protein
VSGASNAVELLQLTKSTLRSTSIGMNARLSLSRSSLANISFGLAGLPASSFYFARLPLIGSST